MYISSRPDKILRSPKKRAAKFLFCWGGFLWNPQQDSLPGIEAFCEWKSQASSQVKRELLGPADKFLAIGLGLLEQFFVPLFLVGAFVSRCLLYIKERWLHKAIFTSVPSDK